MDVLNGERVDQKWVLFYSPVVNNSSLITFYLLDITMYSASKNLRLRSFMPTCELTWVSNIKTVLVMLCVFIAKYDLCINEQWT